MLRYENSLPKLPVPSLAETAAKYLKSVHPLLSPSEFQRTENAIKEFVKPGGIGEKLQTKLVKRAQDPECKNWLAEWWDAGAYMEYRDPVVMFVSYFYCHRDDRHRKLPAQRAAALTKAALSFKRQVDERTLEPDYMRKAPIAMSSFRYMFNTCRIPEEGKDKSTIFGAQGNQFIAVARKNRFYKVWHEVDGKELSTADLETQFRKVVQLAGNESAIPIGVFTSDNRDNWAVNRKALIAANPANEASLHAIEASSFLVCLDDTNPHTLEERARNCWHGDGRNRWYDKPCQFIIFENGRSGFMGEHSMMDGTPTHRLNDYVCNVLARNTLDHGNPMPQSNLPEPEEIKFHFDSNVRSAITKSEKRFDDLISEYDLRVMYYQGYGADTIKQFKSSPDAWAQMMIQLAYYKFYNVNRPTYESASTRKYQLGRTETCRTVSDECVAWCKAMEDPSMSNEQCLDLGRKALSAHVKYIMEASDAKGVDRHLFGLRKLLTPNDQVPEIYTDPAFSYSNHWFLSTSQLSSEYTNGYGWYFLPSLKIGLIG
jgi:carnitine O-acetyltransferase